MTFLAKCISVWMFRVRFLDMLWFWQWNWNNGQFSVGGFVVLFDEADGQSSLIAPVRAECESSISRVKAQLHNIMGDISELKREQIVGARLWPSLCDVTIVN